MNSLTFVWPCIIARLSLISPVEFSTSPSPMATSPIGVGTDAFGNVTYEIKRDINEL